MTDIGLPILYALGLWWGSTGVVLNLNNRPAHFLPWLLLGGTAVFALALFALLLSSAYAGRFGAYLAFTSGIFAWGVLELSYFTGFITGPNTQPCPPSCTGWRRFVLALMTSLYHELLVLSTALFLLFATWSAPNPVGAWTFTVLWLMRWSAKLNIFFGVPNINREWLPEQVRYLHSYMPKRGMNLLFPLSVTAATVAVTLFIKAILSPGVTGFVSVGLTLVTTLLALAVLEHWLLVLPLPDERLWAWALPGDRARGAAQHLKSRDAPRLCVVSGLRQTTVKDVGWCCAQAGVVAISDLPPASQPSERPSKSAMLV